MSLAETLSRSQGLSDRLAVVCFTPDPGHVIPLLKIAAQVRDACGVLVVVPDELIDLVSAYGFEVAGVGRVRPESGLPALHQFIEASDWVRFISAHAAHKEAYFTPLREEAKRSLHRHREHLLKYRPTCILCDEHAVMRKSGRNLLLELKIPSFLHLPTVNIKRHNTWSLRSTAWLGCRATMRGAINKSENEFRLWVKQWAAKWKRVDAAVEIARLPPIRATTGAITYLATGTSFLEAALLRGYLLDLGSDRLVLPTIPPLELPLPHDLRTWLDQYPSGDVVYVSFGTLLKPDAAIVVNIARAALRRGKHVLLQYSGDFPVIPGVRHERWVPQATVLSHPAISLFITHGGASSVEEALWYGKPMLCIPSVWDHFYTSWIASLLGADVTIPRRAVRSPRRLAAGVGKALMPERADSARFVPGLMRKHWSENQLAVKSLFRLSAKTPQTGGSR